MSIKPSNIIISRTDNIGDVVLSLPMAGVLKSRYPNCKITFLGKSYTRSIVDICTQVDDFIAWDDIKDRDFQTNVDFFKSLDIDTFIHVFPNPEIARIAAKARIKNRIGTSRRLYHLTTCNKKINLKRRNSNLHESQLNLKLLEPLGIKADFPLLKIPEYYGLKKPGVPDPEFSELLSKSRINLIIHPRSMGSAREWGLENFATLIHFLPENKYKIFITGTKEDGESMKDFLSTYEQKVIDLTGKMTLTQLVSFINACDGLVAASTGPLHISAALGKFTIGLYAPMRPIHPGRWAPVGYNAEFLVIDKSCNKCRKTSDCECIRSISPNDVLQKLERNLSNLYKR
ncbi:MAG: hypothetical protein A2W91_19020 [Bacteroidetes bacterium GWF2_38_335]|nr:MAG: hypothetical protein A2W91_19020 [Bacteroidetes bacterium GWF2_38_335]OFY80237.1 MAG: hypothetical protein A2281_17175 [Bacteroidetes bacterium RIFOXYA12_FULL_38_20]HBS88736.1 glycosyl transferase family 9 [Bacteroidales bacterium]